MPITQKLLQTFLDIIQINEIFGQEDKIISYVKKRMEDAGTTCVQDSFGNLICTKSGNGEPLLINTHLDIPEPAENIEYAIEGDILKSKGNTILGADPKSGLATIIEMADYLHTNSVSTKPIEFVFTLGEEAGLVGATHLDYSMIASRQGLVIDVDGPPSKIITRAPGRYECTITVKGRTVHAKDWKQGINAIEHMSRIVSSLKQGEIVKGVTFNIGTLSAGSAVNSIAGEAVANAEFRSYDMELLTQTVQDTEKDLIEYGKAHGCTVTVSTRCQFRSYSIETSDPLITMLIHVYERCGIKPYFDVTFGGSDSNVFNYNGISTVVIGSGYYLAHQYDEYINLQDMANLQKLLVEFVKNP